MITSISACAHIFCFISYLHLPSEISKQETGSKDAKVMQCMCPIFYELLKNLFEDSRVACVCISCGKREEGVGKCKWDKRVKALEGKPPAEEQRALGPDEMKERGFDNFLQSSSKR